MDLELVLVMSVGVCLRGATGDPAEVVIDAQRQGRTLNCIASPRAVELKRKK